VRLELQQRPPISTVRVECGVGVGFGALAHQQCGEKGEEERERRRRCVGPQR
jgi:hypothetical protein